MALFVGTTPARSPEEEAKRREHVLQLAASAGSGRGSPGASAGMVASASRVSVDSAGSGSFNGGRVGGGPASPSGGRDDASTGSVVMYSLPLLIEQARFSIPDGCGVTSVTLVCNETVLLAATDKGGVIAIADPLASARLYSLKSKNKPPAKADSSI